MTTTDLAYTSAAELAGQIQDKKLSSVEAVTATLARAERGQEILNCFITICAEEAMTAAQEADAAIARGDTCGPLHGVPFHVKDLVNTAGVRTTFGSLVHEHNVPATDAICIARLKQAGAILIGKTTTPEFGHMPFTEAPLFGRTRNAWSAERTSGGSSGGAAAACAAGIAPLAIATDGGGSTRIPAACNGLVGFKQSLGLVPHDMAPDAFANMSYINPTTRTVMDTALMLEVMAGHDPADPFSLGMPASSLIEAAQAKGDLQGIRIAWTPILGNSVVDSEVRTAVAATAEQFAEFGATVTSFEEEIEPTEPFWLVLQTALWQARFGSLMPEWGDRLSKTLVRQMQGGNSYTAQDVAEANMERTRFFRAVQSWFEEIDILLTPTLSRTAIDIEERLFEPIEIEGKPVDTVRRAWYPYTHPFNLTGNPAVTLPCGLHSDGLPLSIQLVGRTGEDAPLLKAAALFEQACAWDDMRPVIDGLD